jgi:hypothetical protein
VFRLMTRSGYTPLSTEVGPRCCGGGAGHPLGPPAGGHTEQGVVTSALCECGSGAARRRALRGPCLCSNPPGGEKKTPSHGHGVKAVASSGLPRHGPPARPPPPPPPGPPRKARKALETQCKNRATPAPWGPFLKSKTDVSTKSSIVSSFIRAIYIFLLNVLDLLRQLR